MPDFFDDLNYTANILLDRSEVHKCRCCDHEFSQKRCLAQHQCRGKRKAEINDARNRTRWILPLLQRDVDSREHPIQEQAEGVVPKLFTQRMTYLEDHNQFLFDILSTVE